MQKFTPIYGLRSGTAETGSSTALFAGFACPPVAVVVGGGMLICAVSVAAGTTAY
ncbi:hypothetical protein [Paraburkholderia domus]|jgi:hypothetical protein|uniref:hypothetical protein n=1 Tax=Paraburkholderia domus TaxID=2793075 RepID=UPI001913D806|nr:hypothetical protein [Paraburkholderia domus]MBK5049371.1 hypothetical protein [Burkholderia sp. R-70006]MBK5062066.1 hypothetical protein [Burkholderia sp. R-70199]MBK5087320.1 hypothetical protein [Burkholderia sp. R-69927]MBK5124245.1 hypothetical protein [Burkholderia sp. R-69980]MBK5166907.1 hypothetical protein [Burkholderia sp. R-70211]MBK5180746.1 hypothetical protein [Burkholderia sp. R-69749]MCI0147819.1 hypothetical protein [Paraburkholderia sediminicola]